MVASPILCTRWRPSERSGHLPWLVGLEKPKQGGRRAGASRWRTAEKRDQFSRLGSPKYPVDLDWSPAVRLPFDRIRSGTDGEREAIDPKQPISIVPQPQLSPTTTTHPPRQP